MQPLSHIDRRRKHYIIIQSLTSLLNRKRLSFSQFIKLKWTTEKRKNENVALLAALHHRHETHAFPFWVRDGILCIVNTDEKYNPEFIYHP